MRGAPIFPSVQSGHIPQIRDARLTLNDPIIHHFRREAEESLYFNMLLLKITTKQTISNIISLL